MKAFAYTETGTAGQVLKLCECPTPLPKQGEVRVQVRASGINPSDTKRRSGELPQPVPMSRVIPHSDGAGVIDRIGKGVDEAWLGRRVWFHNAQWTRPDGAAGEYVVLPLKHIACLPEQVPFDAGATFGVPLLTAWYGVHLGGDLRGKHVFIAGGGGAVGAYAIQLAKLRGARVITSVRRAESAKIARAMGADHVLLTTKDDIRAEVEHLTKSQGVQHYIEVNLSENADQIAPLLAVGATVATYGSATPSVNFNNIFEFLFKRATLSFFLVYDLPPDTLQQAKDELHALLVANEIKFNVGAVFEFGDIAHAHEAVEAGADGNVVLCQCPTLVADYLQQLDSTS